MSQTIRFLMDGAVHEIRNPDPTATVLNWLRYDARRTGTKEGCAEGDCGACTAVVGTLRGDDIVYRAVNTCILFLPCLDGKQLITVESLSQGGDLHPVQEAMVHCHASQCGFCTPGFVMSLFAAYQNGGLADDQQICDALAGNLCRCTGYGPIMEAARTMTDYPSRREEFGCPSDVETLRDLQRSQTLSLSYHCSVTGTQKRFHAPRTVDALAALLAAKPDATVLAGGTDVGLWVTKQHRVLDTVISVTEIESLKTIEDRGDHLKIGAGVTYADVFERLAAYHADFGEVLRRLGSVQIRNTGTIGGNIANGSPIGDSMPLLIALGARLVLRSGEGQRSLPLEDYFLAYGKQDLRAGEFVEAILLPKLGADTVFRAFKISKRFDQDISAVCAAFALTIRDGTIAEVRMAFGGMAATPKRAAACETALCGQPWTETTVQQGITALGDDFQPISDMRATADYRLKIARNLLQKVYLETADAGLKTRVAGQGGMAHD